MSRRETLGRAVRAVLYYGVADRLPYGPTPGLGGPSRRARRAVARGMLEEAGPDITIEKGAWFGSGRGVRLGARSGIGLDCLVMGRVTIGDDVMMGPRCLITSSGHVSTDLDRPMTQQGMLPDDPVVIEDDVWLGAHVVVLPGVTIGRGSIVAAGAVVSTDVPPYSVVAGVPARVVRTRTAQPPPQGPSRHSSSSVPSTLE